MIEPCPMHHAALSFAASTKLGVWFAFMWVGTSFSDEAESTYRMNCGHKKVYSSLPNFFTGSEKFKGSSYGGTLSRLSLQPTG